MVPENISHKLIDFKKQNSFSDTGLACLLSLRVGAPFKESEPEGPVRRFMEMFQGSQSTKVWLFASLVKNKRLSLTTV